MGVHSLTCQRYWAGDHVSYCVQHWYLQTLLLGFSIVVSCGSLLWTQYNRFRRRYKVTGHDEFVYGSIGSSDSVDVDNVAHNEEAAMVHRVVRRGTCDRVKSAVEVVALMFQLVATGISMRLDEVAGEGSDLSMVAAFWVFCLAIKLVGDNWTHLAVLYAIAWVSSLVSLHSAIIHPFSGASRTYLVVNFVVSTVLLLINWTTKVTSRPVVVHMHRNVKQPAAEATSGLLSNLTFSYLDSLLWTGYKNILDYDDIWDLASDDRAAIAVERFRSTRRDRSLVWKMLLHMKWEFLALSIMSALWAILVFIPAITVKFLLDYVDNPSAWPTSTAITAIMAMLLLNSVANILKGRVILLEKRVSIRLRAALVNEIYTKTLRRPAKSSNSNVINLMSVDAIKMCSAAADLYNFVLSTTQLIMAVSILYYMVLGWSAIFGTLLTMVVVPLDYWVMNKAAKYQRQVMKMSDQRIKKTNELMQCIKIVRYFAWEDMFADRIRDVRRQEMALLMKKVLTNAASISLWLAMPMIISVCTFVTYVKSGNVLTSAVAFTSFTLFRLLQDPMFDLADCIKMVVEASISYQRINKYLNEEELEDYVVPGSSIKFSDDASLTWDNSTLTNGTGFQLQDINLEFVRNSLNVIIGPTGSGKSSLLMAMLGEMRLLTGNVQCPPLSSGAVAYCAQQAWLLNNTIKNNILFGQEMDQERYNKVLYACALNTDLQILDAGDETMVGERGVILSGGQKQRISLARAVYSSGRILLLDDCLSAVDAPTAQHIYDNCLTNPELVKDRTVILVSHNVQLAISKAAKVIVVENGQVSYDGPPTNKAIVDRAVQQEQATHHNNEGDKDNSENDGDKLGESAVIAPGELKEEERARGAVKLNVFTGYLKTIGSPWFWGMIACWYGFENIFKFWRAFWLRSWALDTYDETLSFYVMCYIGITLAAILVTCSQAAVVMTAGVRAARTTFNQLLNSVIKAEARFFDTTPLGQIMNRFSKDVSSLDEDMPDFIEHLIHVIYTALIIAGIISFVTPQFLIFAVFIIVLFVLIAAFYLSSSRELKRLESVSSSPLYQHFGQTLGGVTTIRAYGATNRFIEENIANIDSMNRPSYYLSIASIWVLVRFDMIGAFVAFGAALFIILNVHNLDSGMAGISLSHAWSFSNAILDATQVYAKFELAMNCVERIRGYMAVKTEPTGGEIMPDVWPSKGSVKFSNVSLRYAPELPRVIEGLSFEVKPGERVGVAGRTGAGKSTIITALFRFIEVDEGSIEIDGVDISKLELHVLRRSIAIIPQDPSLFDGTMRSNLDPFGHYSNEYLLQSLQRVHLTGERFSDLDSPITEMGHNLSQGQRQLVCLARALLTNPRILLLDEATASIDTETDSKIQQTIREEFAATRCTIITIAHRMETIADYDRVLVLDQGRLVKFE